ncbi:hypothetical protein G7048_01105 [Diaphorobacter sp. HDW4B]|uniref:hypothetical protein n=1 Tax=Diaphorobacter sp. HDW4B TaxID=2714925 RepID=UPI0014086781|nr:hypothetical protein [Diaphorobacter sp. HDW4B]QIL69112.1 hypothetical protein G7048_01105 [Diaphorobacter sp. HDW4B]
MALIAKALAVWLVILVCAVANGALREGALIPHLGRAPGLILSGVLLSALILSLTFLALPWLRAPRPAQLIGLGVFWLALTLVFEFSFGRFQGKSWATILEAYTFKDGNIWPVVLLVTAAAPYVAARFRGWASWP